MSPAERIEFAAGCGDKVHDGYSDNIEAGVSVAWSRINHMMGCGTGWSTGMPWEESSTDLRDQYYELLQQPAGGRHFMIGDQISYHSSWQEGALGSAEFALLELDRRVRAESGQAREA
jgi:monoamine oxidase